MPIEHSYVWESGSTERNTSSGCTGKMLDEMPTCAQSAEWVSITPLGFEVVPDV